MRPASLLLAFLVLAASGRAQELELRDHGAPLRSYSVEELGRLVSPRTVEVRPQGLPERQEFRAFPFRELLDAVYGNVWRRAEMLMFTCTDGYQPIQAVDDVLRTQGSSRGYLAFERVGGDDLWEEKDGDERDMGPFRLFWKGVGGQAPARVLEVPYMITGIDLIEFDDRFPRLAPPPSSPTEVVRGFNAFRHNCLKCHTLNGDGSDVPLGPDLNYPASVTEYWRRDWLLRFIVDPRTVRHGSRMPGLVRLPKTYGMSGEEQLELADAIVRYLESMARKKLEPPGW